MHGSKAVTRSQFTTHLSALAVAVRGRNWLDTIGTEEKTFIAQVGHENVIDIDQRSVIGNVEAVAVFTLAVTDTRSAAFAIGGTTRSILIVRVLDSVLALQIISQASELHSNFGALIVPAGAKDTS